MAHCEDCIYHKMCYWIAVFGEKTPCEHFIATANVASKSEVERLIETLERKIGTIYNRYVFEDTDYADDDVAIEAVINALTDVLNEIDEFKKKYTEETNGNNERTD